MPEENKTIATRFFAEVCNGRNLEVADELFSAAHTYHDPSTPGVAAGPRGMKEFISVYHRGFPDGHWTVDEMFEVSDTVITRFTGRGTQNGDLGGIAPTGKAVSVVGVWIHRIAKGKIDESWNVWDTLGMMRQLGVMETAQVG